MTATGANRIDTDALLAQTDLVALVGAHVKLKRAGREWSGLCPFHDERSPSFTVNPDKGFVHCFGCGAHHNAIGFVMALTGKGFVEACDQISGPDRVIASRPKAKRTRPATAGDVWIPLRLVPDDAPPLIGIDGKAVVFNPKRGRYWTCKPSRADAYRNAVGELIGYVLRIDMRDGAKITPQVTWCIGPAGESQWCVRPMSDPRPLFGLDQLAAHPSKPVLVVEGEKCALAGAAALPQYVVVTWPGGSKGMRHVDFGPLKGRDVVLWPDADAPGMDAMVGREDYTGRLHDGVAQLAWRAGARSLRIVNSEGQRKGWDIADALQVDGWTPRQLAAWAATRVSPLEMVVDPNRRAA